MQRYEARRIDWSLSREETISSEHIDLPPNIVAFRADHMNAETLQHALSCFKPPVQVVQIEIPVSEQTKKTGQKIATSAYDTFVNTHDEQILKGNKPLVPFFENFSLSRYREEDLEFIKHCMAGPEAINAAGKNFLKLTFASAGVSRLPRYDFHAHAYGNKNPAWYLNTTFAKHASVFVNSDDLAPACLEPDFKGKVIFRMPQPVRWNGIPYSFALFTAGFHPQGNAVHSSYAALNGSPAEDRAVQICIFS